MSAFRRLTPDKTNASKKPGIYGNLVIIGILILVMVGYYYWQLRKTTQVFSAHVQASAGMLASVIRLNAQRAVFSQETIEEIVKTFLANTARFVDYLDNVEPFSESELKAFAAESGLAWIRVSKDLGATPDPNELDAENGQVCREGPGLKYLASEKLYVLSARRLEGPGCISLGFAHERIRAMEKQIGLETLLAKLNTLRGISYVSLQPAGSGSTDESLAPAPVFSWQTAEVRMPLGDQQLVVGVDAHHLFERVALLKNEFFTFTGVLLVLGIAFSGLLHRNQTLYLKKVRQFERRLASEKEDAALGRASATITHELGNPLNAISMGLQRIQMEADTLSTEHSGMLDNLLDAVGRIEGIIRDLRQYTRPIQFQPVDLELRHLLDRMLAFYKPLLESAGIRVRISMHGPGRIRGDAGLIHEVFENLIKNAAEARPPDGIIEVAMGQDHSRIWISFQNSGFGLTGQEVSKICDPYFTIKSRGSGLGLAVVSRIMQAHGGGLSLEVPREETLRVVLEFPENENPKK